jgi:ankyrin repeat protein
LTRGVDEAARGLVGQHRAAIQKTPMRNSRGRAPTTPPTALDYNLLDVVRAGDARRTRELLGQGAAPNAGFSDGEGYSDKTALMYAAEGGHAAVIRELLAAGADLRVRDRFVSPDDGGGETALEYAIRARNHEAARLLLDAGADINAMGGGYTPLMIAVRKRDQPLVRFLLELGADPNRASKVCSPLELAVDGDQPEIVALLLRAGANPNWGDAHFSVTPLIQAAEKGRLECARLLVQTGADVNQADSLGRTPLIVAAERGVIRQLVTEEDWERYGDSPNLAGSCLITDENAREIVELLIAAGADVNARDERGNTPLSNAAGMGREEICRVLRAAGAWS